MTEQLSMFSNKNSNEKLNKKSPVDDSSLVDKHNVEEIEYEALDKQLSDLMVELNDFKADDVDEAKQLNKILRSCTLDISKRTREGQISSQISSEHRDVLLQTTVVGEVGEYMPLLIDTKDDAFYLYLNRYWQYQKGLAEQINKRIESKESQSDAQKMWSNNRLADYFPDDPSSSSDSDANETNWQKRAVELALRHKFLIISGGPGTGKTTTITRLLTLLIEQRFTSNLSATNSDIVAMDISNNETSSSLKKWGGVSLNILLAAPTGKAAIRMLDSIREASDALQSELNLDQEIIDQLPDNATTIHKLLGYKHNSAQFKHNKNNSLNVDVVLVDEASMVDIALMSKLVEAVPEDAKLILIGDKDQLASVETGSVFADLCDALKDSENLVTLKKNWRFAKDSDIGQAAIAANLGDSQSLFSVLDDPNRIDAELISPTKMRDADLIKPWQHYITVVNDPNSSVAEVFKAFNQYRVLCALRRGFNGSEIMNERLETALEKQTWISRKRFNSSQATHPSWYHGKPIMITQNSYDKGLMNGDTGITLIKNGETKVYFPMGSESEFQSFSPIRLPSYETNWAMTIHKSQGSEFEQVLMILPHEEMQLLTRQLVYTGITRAKQTVSIVASKEVLRTGIKAELAKATNIEQCL